MTLIIQNIISSGDITKERVVFKAAQDLAVGFYGVLKTIETAPNTVSNKVRDTYWFPDKDVKKDDLVVLYSKKGINTERKEKDGTTTHFFYWGKEASQWEKRAVQSDALILFKMEEWKHKVV